MKNQSPRFEEKDIGKVEINDPLSLPFSLESTEQQVHRSIYAVFIKEPTTEFRLQFVPRWVVESVIVREKSNYQSVNAHKEIDIDDVSTGTDVILFHHAIQIKTDGEAGKLQLKYRLDPHEDCDRERFYVRAGSSTA